MNIKYSVTDSSELDTVAPLWEKLNEYHGRLSRHFAEDYPKRTWINRKKELLDEAAGGQLRIDLATDTDTGEPAGCCISSIKHDGSGEIDAIFVESDYRRRGIGDNLINSALSWLKEYSAERIIVQVIIDNEEAHPFYKRHGFLPRTAILMQKTENDTFGS